MLTYHLRSVDIVINTVVVVTDGPFSRVWVSKRFPLRSRRNRGSPVNPGVRCSDWPTREILRLAPASGPGRRRTAADAGDTPFCERVAAVSKRGRKKKKLLSTSTEFLQDSQFDSQEQQTRPLFSAVLNRQPSLKNRNPASQQTPPTAHRSLPPSTRPPALHQSNAGRPSTPTTIPATAASLPQP